MVEIKGEAVMLDGTTQTFTAYQWELGEWEKYAIRHHLPPTDAAMTFSLFVAYAAIHRDSWDTITVGFEQWSRQVRGIEIEADEEEHAVPPFPSGVSAE